MIQVARKHRIEVPTGADEAHVFWLLGAGALLRENLVCHDQLTVWNGIEEKNACSVRMLQFVYVLFLKVVSIEMTGKEPFRRVVRQQNAEPPLDADHLRRRIRQRLQAACDRLEDVLWFSLQRIPECRMVEVETFLQQAFEMTLRENVSQLIELTFRGARLEEFHIVQSRIHILLPSSQPRVLSETFDRASFSKPPACERYTECYAGDRTTGCPARFASKHRPHLACHCLDIPLYDNAWR